MKQAVEITEDRCVRQAIGLADNLSALARKGQRDSPDNRCALLYTAMRECARKIRQRAEIELEIHAAARNSPGRRRRPEEAGRRYNP